VRWGNSALSNRDKSEAGGDRGNRHGRRDGGPANGLLTSPVLTLEVAGGGLTVLWELQQLKAEDRSYQLLPNSSVFGVHLLPVPD
jgi:hypothetical protein